MVFTGRPSQRIPERVRRKYPKLLNQLNASCRLQGYKILANDTEKSLWEQYFHIEYPSPKSRANKPTIKFKIASKWLNNAIQYDFKDYFDEKSYLSTD